MTTPGTPPGIGGGWLLGGAFTGDNDAGYHDEWRPSWPDMPKPGGLVGLIFPILLKALMQPDMTKSLTTFKTTLEAS